MEEERRLFYVGMTRAKDRVFLSHARWRMRFGGNRDVAQPSRFLDEIPPELIEGGEPELGPEEVLGAFEAPKGQYAKLKVGDKVSTSYPLGAGVITAVKPDSDPRIILLFDIDYNGHMTYNLNYLHIKAKI